MTNQSASSINPQKPYDLEPNVEAVLSYLISPFTGIAIFLMEKNNKFVRFHAMQSILFGSSIFILTSIANMLSFILLSFYFVRFLNMAFFLTWLFVMWKAYENEEYMLPIIGQVAKDQVNKG